MHKFPFLLLPGKSSYSAKSIASAPESIHCTHSVLRPERLPEEEKMGSDVIKKGPFHVT